MLAVPEDAPAPSEEAYQDFVTDFVGKSLELSEGGGLVLFTSYRMLIDTWEKVAPRLEALGITVLHQGSGEPSKLLDQFHRDISSVLFATSSFWEGVDAPGESLKLVIICRLPFSVPTDPVIQARMEAVEKEGGNPFFSFSLPQAAMRLRQGFGRLMRRKTDRGVVAILDSRIIHKTYGKILLESLPETIQRVKESRFLLQDMENFFFSREE
jgi:ATP-dependent DNA helicase DinG